MSKGLTKMEIRSLEASGNELFAGTNRGGIFRSSNQGESWTPVNNDSLLTSTIENLVVKGPHLFAGTLSHGVFRSSDNGATWKHLNLVAGALENRSLAVLGSMLFAGTHDSGVYRSINDGDSWTPVNHGLTREAVGPLVVNENTVFAGAAGTGLFHSTDNGDSWIAADTGITKLPFISCFAVSGSDLFIVTDGQGIWKRSLSQLASFIKPVIASRPESGFGSNLGSVLYSGDKISFKTNRSGWVNLSLFGPRGELYKTLVNSKVDQGEQQAILNAAGLPQGIYFLRLRAEGLTQVHSFLLRN